VISTIRAENGIRKSPSQKTGDAYIMRSMPNITAPTGNVGQKLLKNNIFTEFKSDHLLLV
jgi:hypothetical protein